MILNYDEKRKPVEIEIINASKFLGEFLSTLIKAKAGEKQIESNSMTMQMTPQIISRGGKPSNRRSHIEL